MNLFLALLRGAALLPLAIAAALGLRAWKQVDAPKSVGAKDGTVGWLRRAFLLLTLAWIVESVWHTVAWGEAWAWDPARNLGVLAWLLCAGALHLNHVPHLKGRKPARRGLAVGALAALLFCGLSLLVERMAPSLAGSSPFFLLSSSVSGPSGP